MKKTYLYLLASISLGLLLAVALLLNFHSAQAAPTAATRYVAADGICGGYTPCYATIQAAVDASSSSDTILVAEGVYTGVSTRNGHTQIVYLNKRVTLRGGYTTMYAEPPDPVAHPTTLDAQGLGRIFYIPYIGNYARVTLEGLRLTGGNASLGGSGSKTGGGLRADGASGDRVTIRNCWIGGNTAEEGGAGGIAFDFTELDLVDSTVISNAGAGAILWNSDSPIITGNTIAGNSAGGVSVLDTEYGDGLVIQGNTFSSNAGNGIYLSGIDSDGGNDIISDNLFAGNNRGLFANAIYGAVLHVHNNTFHNNTNDNNCYADWDIYGGGIWLQGSNAEVLNNTFTENYACYGGGLSIGNGSGNAVLVQGNAFFSNTAGMGGAIHLEGDGNATNVQGNSISGNQAHDAGGLSIDVGAQPEIRRNMVTDNQATHAAGGIYCGSCTVTLEQNQITGNSAGTGGGLYFDWPAFLVPQTVSTLTNNLIADNSAPTGSGMMAKSSNLFLIHNTIAHNLGGAGVYVVRDLPTSVVMTNTIIVSHTVGVQLVSGNASLDGTLWGADGWANGSDWVGAVVTGTVNLWGDPGFVDPASGDYHISQESDALDEGVQTGVLSDLDNDSRPMGIAPDLGADEWARHIYLPLVRK